MITILCPTRGRPDRMHHLVESATRFAAVPPRFVFYVDDDDFASYRTAQSLANSGHRVAWKSEPRHSRPMSDWWNQCAKLVDDDSIVMFVDDEADFQTIGWDVWVEREFERWPDRAVLLQPNDTIHRDADAGYFFVHWPTWRRIFGRLTPTFFSYGYADVWPMEVARAAGRKIYLHRVVIENLAPKLQPPDKTHEENQIRAARDRTGDLYNATQHDRERDVALLRSYIETHVEVTGT